MENPSARRAALVLAALLTALPLAAQERPVPPPGVAVPEADRKDLDANLTKLNGLIGALGAHRLAPDVIIFRDAVRYALAYDEFFKPEDIGKAKLLLAEGIGRANALLAGEAPWTRATGLVVRGYVSKIDGSVQPYGLVIPASYNPALPRAWRLDAWFHGRNETLSEVNFLAERMSRPGEFTPTDTIVVHLYGRYCNANKFAGEIDWLETLAALRGQYRIDENRIVVRGFSMGGAAAWHIAAHYAGDWAAAAPGAGFSETAEFLDVFQKEKVAPPEWEKKLWRMYDATVYAANFFNLPLVAYSGEIDKQKQAADVMERFLKAEGLPMTHIIGPQTAHRYHPESKVEIDRRLDAIAAMGRDPYPAKLRFVTYTLRYNRMKWLTVDGLAQHWEKGSVDATLSAGGKVTLKTAGVTALSLDFGPGGAPVTLLGAPVVEIDGQRLTPAGPASDRSWKASFVKSGTQWKVGTLSGVRKVHGLQGPIDDAFMDSFLFVIPTGQPLVAATGQRVAEEQQRAIKEWRRQFRGDARVKKDTEVTDADLAAHHVVLWGDPSSNAVYARLAAKLPIRWTASEVTVGAKTFPAGTHLPAFVYPNPVAPGRYVVVNSGFTFREYDYLNNARQISKLPDWAVIDMTEPAGSRYAGKVTTAGFFDEEWKLKN